MRFGSATLLFVISAVPALGASCPGPQFQVSDFQVDDGKLDRGYPGGVSFADIDGDGDLDVFATHGYDVTAPKYEPRRSMLYLNDGRTNFTRAEDSALSTADKPASGSTWADIDGDGDLDAFVSTELDAFDAFYRNLGGGRFERQDLGDATKTKGGNFTSTWVDIDHDGDLDLHVGGPPLELPEPTLVYRNDGGAFVRVTDTPIDGGPNNSGAVLWADVDNDGDLDLFVANSDAMRQSDLQPAPLEHAVLYRNEGNWRFTLTPDQAFADNAFPAVAAAFGDVDNDGDLDLLLGLYGNGKVAKQDRLFLNDGKGRFSEQRKVALPGHLEQQYALAFADFNLDGNLDIVSASYNDDIRIFTGDGEGNFRPLDDPSLKRKRAHSSLATGDLNGDGRPDAVIGSWAESSQGDTMTLLINRSQPCGGWTEIVLRDKAGAPNPPGARVTLVTRRRDGGVRRQLREASAQTGFRSQSASAFLFAVPESETIAAAEIRWPNGHLQRLTTVQPNRRNEISEQQ